MEHPRDWVTAMSGAGQWKHRSSLLLSASCHGPSPRHHHPPFPLPAHSRKASLLAASEAGRLPFEFESVAEGMAVQGYVASVTPDAVFVRCGGGMGWAASWLGEGAGAGMGVATLGGWVPVGRDPTSQGLLMQQPAGDAGASSCLRRGRPCLWWHPCITRCPHVPPPLACHPRRFLGGLTARAGLAQLSDTFVSDPRLHFSEGQSVRAHVAQVDTIRQRFSLTLKQSLCAGDSGAEAAAAGTEYLQSLLVDVAVVEQLAAAEGSEVDWEGLFGIGTVGGSGGGGSQPPFAGGVLLPASVTQRVSVLGGHPSRSQPAL